MCRKHSPSFFVCAAALCLAVAGAAKTAGAADGDEFVQKAWAGALEGISQLIDAGADVNATDSEGRSPLMAAASVSKKGTAFLLSHGADVGAARVEDGKTAVDLAEDEGYAEIVAYLKDKA